ncbi:hypothetical protein A2926_02970 [Candidatus Giovannonibacteria bacterium RIFCSPLOWO2_01_FULL_44_40]|uniref:Uncharacterized protein n=1 Tax=Candidatus Giovannonibacteria bacterium RIFCSPHIGHO2_01_FULL_45_23 TaxID=1798325 RepID=A0A1F5VIC4_9BACT|nr:MAG: hypothetical protein A2834_02300 [Candidatus Giovannonibacteria bacterium RIFCSPHIGHO2_01_FULL_45_23]OGF75878.1 MAG: hypothetical protein A3C77_02175 [Candidatus Giovannonibacteria bacterium RIFCSPHIGHO2_02_FULL_45_13]OGF79818.1 MAG: hypothetical protein A2926_02970 [Candidatus Giovannonibacteria bacterium RIFCSPLOWO2_01_FULL_44_40]
MALIVSGDRLVFHMATRTFKIMHNGKEIRWSRGVSCENSLNFIFSNPVAFIDDLRSFREFIIILGGILGLIVDSVESHKPEIGYFTARFR